MTRWQRVLLGAFAGALMALGTPPLKLWPCTIIGIGLFGLSFDGANSKDAWRIGWATGTLATLVTCTWLTTTVHNYTSLGWPLAMVAHVLAGLIGGITLAVAAWLASKTSAVLGYPLALAVSIVVADRWVPSIFPWQMAVPLCYAPWIPQAADVLGVSGLSAYLAAVQLRIGREISSTVQVYRQQKRWQWPPLRTTVLWIALWCLPWIYGGIRHMQIARSLRELPRLNVALIQPNIDPKQRWQPEFHQNIVDQLRAQTRLASQVRPTPDLLVWSEAAFPYIIPHQSGRDTVDGINIIPWELPFPTVIGAITEDQQQQRFNAALLRERDGRWGVPVAKQYLVPFGEHLPVLGQLAWVRRKFARAVGLTPGTQPQRLTTALGLRLGILNCFEDTLPWVGAEIHDVNLFVNITNDAWFGRGGEAEQHLMLARWRSIENRREMVRAVNTGISAHVNVLGQVEQRGPVWTPVILLVNPRISSMWAFAPWVIRWGPWCGVLVLIMAFVLPKLQGKTVTQ